MFTDASSTDESSTSLATHQDWKGKSYKHYVHVHLLTARMILTEALSKLIDLRPHSIETLIELQST